MSEIVNGNSEYNQQTTQIIEKIDSPNFSKENLVTDGEAEVSQATPEKRLKIENNTQSSESPIKIPLSNQSSFSSSTCKGEVNNSGFDASKFLHLETHSNGGGAVLHAYDWELSKLNSMEREIVVQKFFRCLFRTVQGGEGFCIGVVHDSVHWLPEFLQYLDDQVPDLPVKVQALQNKNQITTMKYHKFASEVRRHYQPKSGVYRYGPLLSVSVVQAQQEEVGLPPRVAKRLRTRLQKDPFLRQVMPWGPLSVLEGMDPDESDDGPILWIRPGEQALPSTDSSNSSSTRSSSVDQLSSSSPLTNPQNSGESLLQALYQSHSHRSRPVRTTLISDRTTCHADFARRGSDRTRRPRVHRDPTGLTSAEREIVGDTTAAVGVLKAIQIPPSCKRSADLTDYQRLHERRIVKDVVCFHPGHFRALVERLALDILEPPTAQCRGFWLEDSELSLLRDEGFKYARLFLRDGDIYFIPRNVVHQFKTVSAVCSLAWHVRLKRYYMPLDLTPKKFTSVKMTDTPNNNNNNTDNSSTDAPQVLSQDKNTTSQSSNETNETLPSLPLNGAQECPPASSTD